MNAHCLVQCKDIPVYILQYLFIYLTIHHICSCIQIKYAVFVWKIHVIHSNLYDAPPSAFSYIETLRSSI